MKNCGLLASFILLFGISVSQTSSIDSLKIVLRTTPNDTSRLKPLLWLAEKHRRNHEYDSSLKYSTEALSLAKKFNSKLNIAKASLVAGIVHMKKGNNVIALDYYHASLEMYTELNDKKGMTRNLNNIGVLYEHMGDYAHSLEYYFKALKINEEANNSEGIASNYGNIAVIFDLQLEYEKALTYQFKALKINEALKDTESLCNTLGNIGIIYCNQKEYDKALDYYFRSLQLEENSNYKEGIASDYSNIAIVYKRQGNFQKAEEYYLKARDINKKLGKSKGLSINYCNLGALYATQKKFKEGEISYLKSLDLAKTTGNLEVQREVLDGLSQLYIETNKTDLAFKYYKEFISIRDSITNDENTRKQVETEMQFDFNKKQLADSLRINEERKLTNIKFEQEKKQRYFLYTGLALVIVFAGFVFNRFKVTQKQKLIIEQKEKETQFQKQLVEEKQKEILDSIYYAKRIQQAHLPTNKYIAKNMERLKS